MACCRSPAPGSRGEQPGPPGLPPLASLIGDPDRFLQRHRRELADVPVAVFAMGPRNDTAEALAAAGSATVPDRARTA